MMTKLSKWNAIPLESEIITSLLKNRGEMLSTELFRQLTNKYAEFSKSDFDDALFKLETRSYIYVTSIKKDVQKVELNPNGNFTDEVKQELKKFRP